MKQTIRLSKTEKIFIALLSTGGLHSADELSTFTGLDKREIRTIVNNLRKKSVPILSEKKGYALAVKPGELDATIQRLALAASDTIKVVNALRETQKKMEKGDYLQ